jgi:hypothetical protein
MSEDLPTFDRPAGFQSGLRSSAGLEVRAPFRQRFRTKFRGLNCRFFVAEGLISLRNRIKFPPLWNVRQILSLTPKKTTKLAFAD